MKNRTILYFISAFLWLVVALSSFFIYQNPNGQEAETIIKSSKKIDDLDQEFFDLKNKWWERNELATRIHIDTREMKTLDYLGKSRQNLNQFKEYDNLNFKNINKHFAKKYGIQQRSYVLDNQNLISNEEIYLNNQLNKELYKNILLQIFRNERAAEIHNFSILCGFYPLPELKVFDKNKIGFSMNDFNTISYSSFSEDIKYGVQQSKDFEFEIIVKKVSRNPKTTTKRYKTLPKEGSTLKPFDYEEIE